MSVTPGPLVSIAIPTYNRAAGLLRETLASARAQTYPHLEIIVCDNCSPDHTEAYMREQAAADPRIRYFRHAVGLKPNDNFNFGLQQARGAYFLLLHDDDLIEPDFVEACLRAVAAHGEVGLVRTGCRRIDGQGQTLLMVPNGMAGLSTEAFFRAWFQGGEAPMYLCNSLFNTARLREIGGFNTPRNLFQDVLAELTLAARFGRLDVREVKASYRVHATRWALAAGVQAWVEDSQYLLDALCALAPDAGPDFRRLGQAFFAKHNYRLAAQVTQPVERLRAWWTAYKQFDWPSGYSVRRQWRRLLNVRHRLALAR